MINVKVIYEFEVIFLKRICATRGFSVILYSEIFVYCEGKILEKGRFMDLSNEYKFTYVPE